jgi:hypothetical protein
MGKTAGQRQPRAVNPALIVGIVVVVAALGVWLVYNLLGGTAGRVEKIGDVLADLRQYDGLEVTFEGEVSGSLNLLGYKAYNLNDGTGSITVVTERGLPDNGDRLKVTGIVHEVFSIGGINYTVLYEAQ